MYLINKSGLFNESEVPVVKGNFNKLPSTITSSAPFSKNSLVCIPLCKHIITI